jgi:hypothetical protein
MNGQLIPAWIMDWSFWLAVAATVAGGPALGFIAWCWLSAFAERRRRTDNPELATVPQPVYRIAELREFLDPLFIKLYGRAIDDFVLVRIDHALGKASVSKYRRLVLQQDLRGRGHATAAGFFIALARDTAYAVELSASADLSPRDVLALKEEIGKF